MNNAYERPPPQMSGYLSCGNMHAVAVLFRNKRAAAYPVDERGMRIEGRSRGILPC
jgi:hypothetical protein